MTTDKTPLSLETGKRSESETCPVDAKMLKLRCLAVLMLSFMIDSHLCPAGTL